MQTTKQQHVGTFSSTMENPVDKAGEEIIAGRNWLREKRLLSALIVILLFSEY